MRFLYFGDMHKRITTPENRKDNFQETMNLKTEEILAIGKKYKVSAYLEPGDFWDIPNPPLDYASSTIKQWFNVDVFDILQKMTAHEKIEKELAIRNLMGRVLKGEITDMSALCDELNDLVTEDDLKDKVYEKLKDFIPMIGVAGNHELFGNNISTLPKTMTGFMEKLGLLKFATKENPVFFNTEDGLKIAITGTHYHLDIDSPEHIDDYVVEDKLGDIHIHIVHGLLSDKSMGSKIRHTIIDQIKHTKADLTITGHDHIGFPITEVDGKYFVNPGGISRLTNDLKEMKRKPKILLIDITKEHGLRLKETYLKSAQDGNLVLDRQKIIAKKEKESKIEEFKKTVREAELKTATDITEIIRDIADNEKLPKEIKESIVNKVSTKKEEINQSNDGAFTDAFIDKVIIENFHSHKYTELDFSRGFNLFVGESRQGKSAVLRAMGWVYENKPVGKKMIKRGADYAKVTLHLSNGYIVSRYVEAKNNGKNGYYITDPNTGETEFHNTKILPEIQKILGFTTLNIDSDVQYNINFSKQGSGWFLIGEHFSSPARAKLIGGIYGTQYADAVIRDIDREDKQLNDNIKKSNKSLESIEKQIEGFDYLEDLKESISSSEQLVKELELLQERKQKIVSILDKREVLVQNIKENQELLNELNFINNAKVAFAEIKRSFDRKERLEDLVNKREKFYEYYTNSKKALFILKDTKLWASTIDNIKNKFEKRVVLERIIDKKEELLKNINSENEIIAKTKEINNAKVMLYELICKIDRAKNIEKLVHSKESFVKAIKEQDIIIKETESVDNSKKILSEINQRILDRQKLDIKTERAKKLEEDIIYSNKVIKSCSNAILATERVDISKEIINKINELILKKEKMTLIINEREKFTTEIQKAGAVIKEQNNKIKEDIIKYQEVLETAGKCPVCYGTIDKATINRIVAEHTIK
ncbi:MAG: hypothetical protein K0R54_15 [Clostridiaceae bacterium]|jgi:exonuclease SbcC|nr:hypothetical protein [Clostridiaceae bacterium]